MPQKTMKQEVPHKYAMQAFNHLTLLDCYQIIIIFGVFLFKNEQVKP